MATRKRQLTTKSDKSTRIYYPTKHPENHINPRRNQIKQLYKATETYRERAILSLFYGCGLRRTEGEKLNIKDIHFRNNLLYVREGKNKKRRAIPISQQVKTDLQNYIYKERKGEDQAVILNQIGRRMRGDAYNKILKNIIVKSNVSHLESDISLHCLRHSIATHLLESGLSVEYVRDFLGHKNLESTQVYTRVNKGQLYKLSTL
ncbi:MAG: tyrosine-type recombinase/integrase [Flavobacteriales bacterium]|nr:tyrosine-type recombinase/integrase [Flavobacteriales bacterium]